MKWSENRLGIFHRWGRDRKQNRKFGAPHPFNLILKINKNPFLFIMTFILFYYLLLHFYSLYIYIYIYITHTHPFISFSYFFIFFFCDIFLLFRSLPLFSLILSPLFFFFCILIHFSFSFASQSHLLSCLFSLYFKDVCFFFISF